MINYKGKIFFVIEEMLNDMDLLCAIIQGEYPEENEDWQTAQRIHDKWIGNFGNGDS